MQTTLRINDEIYRAAKAQAALEGVTLTSFLEEALKLRLKDSKPTRTKPYHFRVYSASRSSAYSDAELKRLANEEQEKYDAAKLGIKLKS